MKKRDSRKNSSRESGELEKLKRQLEKTQQVAQEAIQARNMFLASMGHEIRTPMNGIIGMAELLLDTDLTEIQRTYLVTLRSSAETLLRVLGDILDFSKIEAHRLELEHVPFDFRRMVEDTLQLMSINADRKGIELLGFIAPEIPDIIIGDSTRLGQVLFNLINNAIKFTSEGEVVLRIEIESSYDTQVGLHFSVRDTGIGISKEKIKTVFSAFSQAESSITRKYGGTGLGLTISSKLVEAMGGKMWVDSHLDQGSTFHFTLSLPYEKITHPKRDIKNELKKLKGLPVLVVDDNATNRDILSATLKHWNMQPTLVASGPEALDQLEKARQEGHPFGLILMDGHMPEMDGFELAKQMKQRKDLNIPALVMLSSLDSMEKIQHCQEVGILSHLTKPVRQSELLNNLIRLLDR